MGEPHQTHRFLAVAAALTALLAAGLAAGPAPAHAACAGETEDMFVADSAAWQRGATAMICVINEKRASRGLPALTPDPALMLAARRHADDMSARNYSAHDAPEPAPYGVRQSQRAIAAGYPAEGVTFENLVGELRFPFLGPYAWIGLTSEGHCATAMSAYATDIGVAIVYRKGWGPSTVGVLLTGLKRSTGSRVKDYSYAAPCPDPNGFGRAPVGTLPPCQTGPAARFASLRGKDDFIFCNYPGYVRANDPETLPAGGPPNIQPYSAVLTDDAPPPADDRPPLTAPVITPPAGTGTPTTPAGPTAPAALATGVTAKKVRLLRAKRRKGPGVTLTLACVIDCAGQAVLQHQGRTVAARQFAIPVGQTRKVTLRLKKRAARRMKRSGDRAVTFTLQAGSSTERGTRILP